MTTTRTAIANGADAVQQQAAAENTDWRRGQFKSAIAVLKCPAIQQD